MIRLRKADGSTETLASDVTFVELCCPDKSVAAVIAVDSDGNAHTVEPGTVAARRYSNRYKDAKWAKVVEYVPDANR